VSGRTSRRPKTRVRNFCRRPVNRARRSRVQVANPRRVTRPVRMKTVSGRAVGSNWYRYANGNPVMFNDPLGTSVPGGWNAPFHPGGARTVQANIDWRAVGKTGVFVAAIPVALLGGGIIEAALISGELGTSGAVALSVGSGASLGAVSNTANQLIDNGGNLAAVDLGQQARAAVVGGAFGIGSGGIAVLNHSLEERAAAQIAMAESNAAFAQSTGRYLGMSEAEIEAASTRAETIAGQIEARTAAQTGALSTLDTYGSPSVSPFVEEALGSAFGAEGEASAHEGSTHEGSTHK